MLLAERAESAEFDDLLDALHGQALGLELGGEVGPGREVHRRGAHQLLVDGFRDERGERRDQARDRGEDLIERLVRTRLAHRLGAGPETVS